MGTGPKAALRLPSAPVALLHLAITLFLVSQLLLQGPLDAHLWRGLPLLLLPPFYRRENSRVKTSLSEVPERRLEAHK